MRSHAMGSADASSQPVGPAAISLTPRPCARTPSGIVPTVNGDDLRPLSKYQTYQIFPSFKLTSLAPPMTPIGTWPNRQYPAMLRKAIRESPAGKLPVSEIYEILISYDPSKVAKTKVPLPDKKDYVKSQMQVFQENIRQILTRKEKGIKAFLLVKDDPEDPNKGFWKINPGASEPLKTLPLPSISFTHHQKLFQESRHHTVILGLAILTCPTDAPIVDDEAPSASSPVPPSTLSLPFLPAPLESKHKPGGGTAKGPKRRRTS
jgi:hypothetical protein